jgi:hypothetical protein
MSHCTWSTSTRSVPSNPNSPDPAAVADRAAPTPPSSPPVPCVYARLCKVYSKHRAAICFLRLRLKTGYVRILVLSTPSSIRPPQPVPRQLLPLRRVQPYFPIGRAMRACISPLPQNMINTNRRGFKQKPRSCFLGNFFDTIFW